MGDQCKEDYGVNTDHRSTDPEATRGKAAVPDQPIYQIRVKGHLGDHWADWFEGLAISQERDGSTVLTGSIADQAALHSLLVKLRNLCLPLISVNPVAVPTSGRSLTEEEKQRLESRWG
jgi:hypothetical protein